ncbi:putative invertase inhibitor [Aristolochia californica]|uniref:putative invertase inhibitor n=1 Tax=Aristolochia californica TaxID=171875 RepID=UPI0035D7F13F
MAAKSLVSVLPLLCLVFVSIQTPHVANAHGISYINKICQRATRFNPAIKLDFCVTSLQTVPESYTTEIAGLLKITTDLALQNASRTSGLIKKMNSVACEDLTKDQLNTCLNAYTSAVSSLQESVQACAAKKYDGAKLGVVLDGAAQCEKAFENGNGSLLADENRNLRQLVTIAQALHRFATKYSKH